MMNQSKSIQTFPNRKRKNRWESIKLLRKEIELCYVLAMAKKKKKNMQQLCLHVRIRPRINH